MAAASEWIDTVLARAAELRRAGVLSIEAAGCSAVFAPAEPEVDVADAPDPKAEAEEPANHWENAASYPTGRVPSIGEIERADEMPDIPTFGDG